MYGVEHGGDRKNQSDKMSSCSKTQDDIAELMNMDTRTLQRYKQLADMMPELSDMVDTGTVTKTTALAIMKVLSEHEQEELISTLDATKKYTQKQVEEYIEKLKQKDATIVALQSRKPEVVEKVIDNKKSTRTFCTNGIIVPSEPIYLLNFLIN